MKKMIIIACLLPVIAGCGRRCEVEPIVEQNQRLIVPPNFGARPPAE